jgi:hypothetical protein
MPVRPGAGSPVVQAGRPALTRVERWNGVLPTSMIPNSTVPFLNATKQGSECTSGERSYCMVGEWDDMDSLAAARPSMISMLDGFRDTLEDLGDGLGVTDPVSGEVAVELRH